MSEFVVVLITASSQEEADLIASDVVNSMLAACVNVIPGVTSLYRWKGALQRDEEWLLVVKSKLELLDALVQRVRAIHSYDVPEIIALPLIGGSQDYLRWLGQEIHGGWHAVD